MLWKFLKENNPDGDLEVMNLLRKILKKGKTMLLTIPVGKDEVFIPFHRIYGTNRLPLLLKGWEILNEEFWIKEESNHWILVDKNTALNKKPQNIVMD